MCHLNICFPEAHGVTVCVHVVTGHAEGQHLSDFLAPARPVLVNGVREMPSCSSTLNVMTEAVLLLQLHPPEMPSDHCCGMSVSGETEESSQPDRMVLLEGWEFPSQSDSVYLDSLS